MLIATASAQLALLEDSGYVDMSVRLLLRLLKEESCVNEIKPFI